MDNNLNTPQAILLLRQAAERVVVNHDVNMGAEILRLVRVLGLRVYVKSPGRGKFTGRFCREEFEVAYSDATK
jgi:hypothetical protein